MTVVVMMHVDQVDHNVQGDGGSQKRTKKPYQAHHPHSHHHRRVRAQPTHQQQSLEQQSQQQHQQHQQHPHQYEHKYEQRYEPQYDHQFQPQYDTEIGEVQSPTPVTNPNDPFEKHFLAASLSPVVENKGRSSSFRNDKPKPIVIKRDAESYSSSPNLLFPKDDPRYEERMLDARGDAPMRRVRSFKSTGKGGVVNRGDSFRKKNSSRNVAHGSLNGHDQSLSQSQNQPVNFQCTPKSERGQTSYFKIQVVGAPGCGKTSITNQFMSSDYANAFDSMNVDDIERTVTIQLDGEEQTMEFIDALPWDDSVDHDIDITADAYVIVYSVIDRSTYDAAIQSLYKLRHGIGSDRPIVLVGNKIDLVRKRKVKREDVLSISRTYDCLHFETSAALNHHVDELLVSILKQIRHKLNPDLHPSPISNEPEAERKDEKGATGFLVKLYRRISRKGRKSKQKK